MKSSVFFALLALPLRASFAQEAPKTEDSFKVEPPLLVQPGDPESEPSEVRAAKLEAQLEQAKRSVSLAEKLVKIGVLAKVEAEQRALRVLRLESELAGAELAAANEQTAIRQADYDSGKAGKPELDAVLAKLAEATTTAQHADEVYRKALFDAAELNLRRQRRLLAMGSARKSDVARAEEKLATLQREETTR